MRHSIRHFWSVPLCFVALSVPCPAVAQDTPKVELSGGYQWLDTKEESNFSLSQGWYADAAYNWNKMIGIVAQVGGGYDSRESGFSNEGFTVTATGDVSVHDFMGGIRLNDRRSARAVWFGQVLAGGVRVSVNGIVTGTGGGTTISQSFSESRTYFGLQFGGSVNLAISRKVGVRVGVGSLRVFHQGEEDRMSPLAAGDGTNVFRFTAGIVLPFARQ